MMEKGAIMLDDGSTLLLAWRGVLVPTEAGCQSSCFAAHLDDTRATSAPRT
jgi:hypothetical protein